MKLTLPSVVHLAYLSIFAPILSAEDGFTPLFNGKDLTGWVEVNTAPSTWHFNDEGYLVCSGKPIGEIRTERMYQNFILELEWRHLVPKGNAGVFVWADDITAKGKPFIRGVEIQILENAYGDNKSHTCHGDIFPIHGAVMTPLNGNGRGMRTFPTEKRSKPSPEWNHYRIECLDGTISLAVNGKLVSQGKDCSPRKGYICIESEGGVLNYRNVRIKELPDTPVEPDQIAIEHRGFRCLYTGVDLSGWKTVDGWHSRDWELEADDGAHPLESAESFSGNLEFIVDFNFTEKSGPARISLRGAVALIPINHPALEKTGNYNRFQARLIDGTMKPFLNDVELDWVSIPDDKGPVVLNSEGPTFWANPYIRPLPEDSITNQP